MEFVFLHSAMKEFSGLTDREVFTPVPLFAVKDHKIYGSLFVDTLENEGKPSAYKKSCLAAQGFNNSAHGFLTYAPTFQRVSKRLYLNFFAMREDLKFFTRDVTQAYVQSKTSTQRAIYVRHPTKLGIPFEKLLCVIRPHYGISQAGRHWYQTYHNHLRQKLSLNSTAHNPCFLYTKHGMVNEKDI